MTLKFAAPDTGATAIGPERQWERYPPRTRVDLGVVDRTGAARVTLWVFGVAPDRRPGAARRSADFVGRAGAFPRAASSSSSVQRSLGP